MERLIEIEGTLTPDPRAEYDLSYSTGSFDVTLNGSSLTAKPKAGHDFEVDAGIAQLEEELSPLLSSLAAEGAWAVGMTVDHAKFDEGGGPVSRGFGSASAGAVIAVLTSGAERQRLLLARIEWATKDPIYRDVLDFFTEAKAAANPRPALTRLWERLEVKYGGENAVKTALSISKAELRAIKGDQSRYEGDRHATYPAGSQPARIDEKARNAALVVGRKIVSTYEQQEFGFTGLSV